MPVEFVEATVNVCGPAARPLSVRGLVQPLATVPESSWQVTVCVVELVEENVALTLLPVRT